MKKLLLLFFALLTGVSGVWAQTVTWTSSVTSGTNFSTGWFTVSVPFNGTISSFTIELGSGTGGSPSTTRTDAKLAISSGLKSATTAFTSDDFVAISTNSCGTSDSNVTMNFSNEALVAGTTYYFYFVTEDNGVYTTINQRYHASSRTGAMSYGWVGDTSEAGHAYEFPFSCTMTPSATRYRIQGIVPSALTVCYLCSKSDDENKLQRTTTTTPSVTDTRYLWDATFSGGVKLQNVGNTHYIPAFTSTSSNGSNVNYLSATADNAVSFTVVNRADAGAGYITLKTQYNSTDTWLNNFTSSNDYVGCHNSSPFVGDQFRFVQVKTVTFSTAVSVNGGDAVSTIWVATDGSDSFTLPTNYKYTFGGTTYYAADAAAAIAAAGATDLTVTVSSAAITDLANLSNTKAYVITNSRGTWQFADDATSMSAASATYNTADEAQQVAIISRNSNYYLYSVNAGAYLTGDNTLTTKPTDNEQVDIVATENASYPWFFRFKNLKNSSDQYTNNINVSSGLIKIDGWGPNGSNTNGVIDEGNSNAIIEAVDFDATAALAMFNEISVTYHLQWSDGTDLSGTVADVVVSDARQSGNPAESLPATFENPFVTFSYSPAAIPASGTVTVTATWNGPFNIADSYDASTQNIWYVVDMHSNENNYTWQYDATSGEIQTPVIAKDAYGSLTDANLWCFVGNPYQGFKIYNKSAGSTMTIRKENTGNTVSYMSTTDNKNLFKLYNSTSGISNSYCFKLDDDTYYLNKQNLKLQGWTDTDGGSSCRFFAPGEYYLAVMNTWVLDAPIGAVGTKSYITSESLRDNLAVARTNITNDPFCVVGAFTTMNTIMNPIRDSETITLGNGYYRVVSAVPGFNNTAAWYYNPSTSADHITWAKAATTTEHQVNSIFKFTVNEDKWNIYSPNAGLSLTHDATAFGAQTGTIGAEAGDVTIEQVSGSTTQYTLKMNVQTIHANNHQNGSGNSGTLINYNANGVGETSTWYLVKVDELEITLNDGGDVKYYATMCLPFDVTITDANTSAYTLTLNSANDGLTLSEAMTVISAGTPVLLRGTHNKTKLSLAANAATSAPLITTSLTGVYVDTSVTGGTDYFLGKDETDGVGFYHWDGTTLKANRAYFEASKLPNPVKGFVLNWDDTDAIRAIDNGQLTKDNEKAIYNLAGQRVQKTTKGLYIVNGKKVVVK